jgi:hypothetical protein
MDPMLLTIAVPLLSCPIAIPLGAFTTGLLLGCWDSLVSGLVSSAFFARSGFFVEPDCGPVVLGFVSAVQGVEEGA